MSTRYGVRTEYDYNLDHKREKLTVWSGPFYSVFEADALSLKDGFMLTTYNDDKIRVTCPNTRNGETFEEVDQAIADALHKHALEGLARLERGEAVLPDSGRTSGEHEHDWQLTENGYSRKWSTEIETDPDGKRTIVASYGGVEDFSADGDGQMFLECLQCGATEDVDSDTTEIEYL